MNRFASPLFHLLLLTSFFVSGCSMRDENGNINPAQIRQNVIDAHNNVSRANEAINNGAQAVNEGVTEAVSEITKPKAPPPNVTQPDR